MYIKISMNKKSETNHGFFEGWGSSLCWWANRIGYSEELTKKAAELFYGIDGLRLNIMRYNIGGGDAPEHNHIKRTDSAIPGWTYYDEKENKIKYDYEADANQINVLRACYKQSNTDCDNYTYVEAFSNSAPYYMTVSGCTSGSVNPAEDNLKAECYEEFAEYLAHVSAYITNELGIKVKSIAAMNEPDTDYWRFESDKQEGCHISPGKPQSEVIVKTKEAFEKYKLGDVVVSASDETSTDKQLSSCGEYTKEAWKAIDRLSTHSYMTEKMEELGCYAAEKGYNLWMSEVDGSFVSGDEAGEMGAALGFAKKIIDDINGLSPSAWVMWQLIDNHISKDGYNGNSDFGMPDLSGGYWGVAVCDHDKGKIILTKKYYAFGQFSRYMRPGCTIIHCGENALSAYNEKTNELSLCVINTKKTEEKLMVDLSEFRSDMEKTLKTEVRLSEEAAVIRTSGSLKDGENWKKLKDEKIINDKIETILKGNSITTYVIKWCRL